MRTFTTRNRYRQLLVPEKPSGFVRRLRLVDAFPVFFAIHVRCAPTCKPVAAESRKAYRLAFRPAASRQFLRSTELAPSPAGKTSPRIRRQRSTPSPRQKACRQSSCAALRKPGWWSIDLSGRAGFSAPPPGKSSLSGACETATGSASARKSAHLWGASASDWMVRMLYPPRTVTVISLPSSTGIFNSSGSFLRTAIPSALTRF